MSAGFTKLFSQILDSTIWREDDRTRILWITMLAMADRDGIVKSSIPGLADRARISIEDCAAGLTRFHQPDKYSTSQDYQGRRITTVEGGWLLINHGKYRALMSSEDQREKARIRKQNQRARVKQRDMSRPVTPGHECHDIAEADTYKNPSSELNPSSDAERATTRKNTTPPSQEASRLAELLKTEILRNKPDYRITPRQERSWARTAERMIRVDDRDPKRIAKLISWAQRDEFWMSNILSMDKLRDKFDALEMKASGSKKAQPKIINAADEARRQLAEERARERAHAAGNEKAKSSRVDSVQVRRYNNNLAAMLRGRAAPAGRGSGVGSNTVSDGPRQTPGTTLAEAELCRGVATD